MKRQQNLEYDGVWVIEKEEGHNLSDLKVQYVQWDLLHPYFYAVIPEHHILRGLHSAWLQIQQYDQV